MASTFVPFFARNAALFAILFAAVAAQADQIWDGGGADNNWNTAGNWGGDTLPNFANPITFTGNTRNGAVNNVTADSVIGGINFTNTGATGLTNAFTLSGNRITLGGNITTTANAANTTTITDTISLAMILNGNRTITTNQNSSTIQHNLTISGVISEDATARALTKAGAGTLILSGANSYTGLTTVSAGVLNIQNATALGTTLGGTSVTSGAALAIQGNITVGAEALTLNGTGISNGGALRNISGTNTYGGLVTLGSASRINSDAGTLTLSNSGIITGAFGLSVGGAGNTTINSIIGTGIGTLVKDGAGTLTLTGSNTFGGGTTISAGTLVLGNATDTLLNSGAVTVDGSTAILSIGANSDTVGLVTLRNGASITGSTGVLTGSSYALESGTVSARLSGLGTLTKTTTGAVSLSGGNDYTGGSTISGGALSFVNTGAKSATGTHAFGAGTTLGLGVAASGSFFTTADIDNAFTNNMVGNLSGITLDAATNIGIDTTAGDFAYSIVGSSSRGLSKLGTNTLALTGTNAFSGPTTIFAGTLSATSSDALGDGSATNTLVFSGGTLLATGAISSPSTRSVSMASTGNINTNGNSVSIAGAVAGAGGLTKSGAGTLTLSGLSATTASNYSGTTTIDNGTLAITTVGPSLTGGLTFGATAGSTNTGTLDLPAGATFTGGMVVQTNSTTANAISVGAAQTLRVNGAVAVGFNNATVATTGLNVSGAGTFTVGAVGEPTNANFVVGVGGTTNISNPSTLDMGGLGTFYANLGTGTFRVGEATNANGGVGGGGGGSTVILAPTSTIVATTVTTDSPTSTTHSIRLGSGANEINATTINIGATGGRSQGLLDFSGAAGTIKVRGLDGSARANMNVQNGTSNTANSIAGTVDFSNHGADLLLGTLAVGGRSVGTTGPGTGTFSYNSVAPVAPMGVGLDATTLNLAARTGTTLTTGTVTGTANLGANFTIGTVTMSTNSSSASTTGDAISTLNISGGTNSINTLTMGLNTVSGATGNGSDTNATINISGGSTTVNTAFTMGRQNSATNAATTVNTALSTLNISAGSLTLAGSTNLTMGATTLDAENAATATINITGGTLTVGGDILYTNGPGTETNSINLNGGTLDMTGGILGGTGGVGPGDGLIALTYTSGTLKNVGTVSSGITLAGSGSRVFDQDNGVSGTIQGAISGAALGLTKQGLGSLALAGTNTYTGSTLVSGGTLALSGTGAVNTSSGITIDGSSAKLFHAGSVAISPTVTVTNGTLTGSGTVNTVNVGDNVGAIISNNDGVAGAALTIGNLTLTGAANLNLFSGPLTSNLNVTGTLTTAATPATLTANNVAGWTNGATYTILTFGGGSIAGSGDNFVKLTNNLTARQVGTYNTSSSAITLGIVGDNPKWTGNDNGNWQLGITGVNKNWQLIAAGTPTDFLTTDDVIFDDTATGSTTLSINAANVLPNTTNFNNSTLNYTIGSTGGFGIANGILTKSGTGSLTINTANTYAGATTLNAGTLVLGNANAIGTGTFTIAGGSLDSSVANLVNTGNNVQAWNSDINFIGTQSLNLGTGAVTMNANRAVSVGANTLTVGGAIGGGAVSLTKNGAGTLALTAANTYSGGTAINAGTVSIGNATALGGNAGAVSVASGAALDLNGVIMTGTNALTLNGSGVSSGGAIANSSAAAATYAGAVTLGSSTTIVPGAGHISLSSTLGMGANALTKLGANALTLNGVVSGTKTVDTVAMQINAGTVVAGVNTNTFNGDIAVDGAGSVFQVNTGATYTTTAPWGTVAGGTSTKQLFLTNGGAFRLASGTLNVNNTSATNIGAGIIFNLGTGGGVLDVAGGATLIIDDGAATLGTAVGASQIQGSGNITKIGTGTLQIDDSTLYAGNIIVNAGLLQPASANAFGTSAGNTTINSGAALNVNGITMTNQEPLTITGSGLASNPQGALTNNSATAATWAGPVTLGGASSIGLSSGVNFTLSSTATVMSAGNTLTVSVTGAGNLVTNGVISGSGGVVVNGSSTGVWATGSAQHTYSGGTILNPGSFTAVQSNSTGALGSPTGGPFGSGANPLTLAGGAIRAGTAGPFTVGNTLTISADTVFNGVASERSLAFSGPVTLTGGNRTLTSTVGTVVTGTTVNFSGSIGESGTSGLIKAGAGNLILSGANTYTGATVVNDGFLNVRNTQASTGLTVAPTALGGATYSLAGNSANPLSGLTTLSLGSAAGPTTIGLDLGSASDSITTANAATATNTINFTILANTGFGAGNYNLINALSGLTSSAPTYGLTNVPGGFTYAFTNTDSQVQLNVSAAPVAADLFWRGGINSSWAGYSAGNSNWFTDAAGTTNAQSNPALQFVNFSNANATGPTISSTLDNNFTVQGLKFNPSPSLVTAVTINPGLTPALLPGVLTIAPTAPSDGITLSQGSGAVTISAPIALGATQTWSVDSSTPGVGAASSLTVSGAITGAASNSITFTTIAGTNPIILSSASGSSTYSGGSTVSVDTIVQGGATNAFSTNTAWTVNGTLNTGAFSQSTGSLVSGNGLVQNGSATNATLTIGNDNLGSPIDFAGTIQNGSTGTLGITKTGTGTQTLSGVNTYSGATTVSAGTLALSGARTAQLNNVTVGNLAGNTGTLNISNGTFTIGNAGSTFLVGSGADPTIFGVVNQSGGTLTTAGNQLLLGNGAGTTAGTSSTGTYNLSGGTLNTIAGGLGVTIGTNVGATGIFNLSGTGNLNMAATSNMQIGRADGNVTPNTTGTFTQTGGTATVGILSMAGGANTGTTATMSLTGGTFNLTTFNSLSAGTTSSSTINIGGTADVTLPNLPTARGTGSTATLTFNGGILRNSATGTFITGLDSATINGGGATFDTGLNSTTINQALLAGTGNGGLTKQGANTLTLSGVNTYTGPTTVSAGTLTVNGSVASASAVTVATGATLNGSGSVAGPVLVNGALGGTGIFGATIVNAGGILAPGTGPGNVNFTSLSLQNDSIFNWELTADSTALPGTNFDTVSLTGGLTIGSSAKSNLQFAGVDWASSFWTTDQTWNVFTGATSLAFGNLEVSSISGGTGTAPALGSFSWVQSGNNVNLQFTAVPEPSSLALASLFVGVVVVAARRAKRRKQTSVVA